MSEAAPEDEDVYCWHGDAYERELYPYVVDALDIAAFNLYCQRGFFPPQRRGGFLDLGEARIWEAWRKTAKALGAAP